MLSAGVLPSGTRTALVIILNFGCFIHPRDLVSPTLTLTLCGNSWVPGTIDDMISITIQNHPPTV
jgi:hypothetical protein